MVCRPLFLLCRSGCAALAVLMLAAAPAAAENVLRWASQGDALTMDPHAQNEGQTLAFAQQIYEPLIERDPTLAKQPALALSWRLVNPTTWEFKLRPGVSFHEGQPFTADDVVFSFKRALAKTSDMKEIISEVADVVAIDPLTVQIKTRGPDPILPDKITNIYVMSRAWAEKHGVTQPQDTAAKQETYAVRHANGTGPFKLELREPDVRTVWVKNPAWWGLAARAHNVDRVQYIPIRNAATRVAALLSGELELVIDPPIQDVARIETAGTLAVQKIPEVRTIFIGMNTARPELKTSSVKGRNPFADIRVRRAVNMAVNADAIVRSIMRGQAVPAGHVIPPGVHGYDKALDARLPFDVAGAKQLLAEAGYPDGFDVRLDCTNDRYLNDEAICQAVVNMLARAGIKVSLDLRPRTIHMPKLQNDETDFYLLGWGAATMDAHYHLDFLAGPRSVWNRTGFADTAVIALIDALATEQDVTKRDAMLADASRGVRDSYVYLPLHHQMIAWATRKDLEIPIAADNQPQFSTARFVGR